MTSVIGPSGLRLFARPGPWKRFAPAAALLLLFALAIGMEWSLDSQYAVSRIFSAEVRRGVAQGDLLSLAQAGFALCLWLFWLSARLFVFFAAVLLVEVLLLGPPKSWRVAGFALSAYVAASLTFLLAAPVINKVLPLPFGFGPLLSLAPARLEAAIGPAAPVLLALAALVLLDFVSYWIHRAQHAIPLLWRFHSVHHSVEEMDSLNSYVHPVDMLGHRAGLVILSALVGLEVYAVVGIFAFQSIHDRLLHTRAPINFGIVGRLVTDNRYHFVHHSSIDARAGANFSSVFTIFDHIFGTYRAPDPTGLEPTGLGDRLPPTTLGQFFLARLAARAPAEPSGPPTGGARRRFARSA